MDYTSLSNTESPQTNTEKDLISEGKDTTDIDEILIEKYNNSIFFLIIFFVFFPPLGFIFLYTDLYKRVIIIDSQNKRIIHCYKNYYGCIKRQTIYDYSQIGKIRLYITSTPDRTRPFDKLYFINGDIYSKNNDKNTLFSNISYDEEKYKNYATLFKKHLNIEVEPFEVGQ